MALPPELQYMVLSFVPQSEFIPVCKGCENEIQNIQKNAADKIGSWYKSRKVSENHDTVREMVRYFVVHYPEDFFLMRPEFTVLKLGLNEELVTVLPSLVGRRRSEVRDWMLKMPIELEDWIYVGW